jgi:hypothetical protein
MSDDLRTLAKAVVADPNAITARRALGEACHCANLSERAAWLLTALDAADAQGYARAMVEVVAYATDEAVHQRWEETRTGAQYVADWAHERLPQSIETQNKGQKE